MAKLDDDDFRALQRAFLANVAGQLEAMGDALSQLSHASTAPEDALELLKYESHKLRGSGASFGYPEISRVAGEIEDYLEGSGTDVTELEPLVGALKDAATGDDDPKP